MSRMINLKCPVTESDIRQLKCGDEISLSGTIVTARDMAHEWLLEKYRPKIHGLVRGGALYHCGPIMLKNKQGWKVIAAGPTTSYREESCEYDVIKKYEPRIIIGKGGMGPRTARALSEFAAVYCHATGGCGVSIADSVVSVKNVFKLDDFGTPEALWVLEIKNLPLIVTMDSKRNSLHELVKKNSGAELINLLEH